MTSSGLTADDLELLRKWARDHDPGRHAIAMACSLLLGDGSSRSGPPTRGQIEQAERAVRNGWAEMVGEQASDDEPTSPRTKTGKTAPLATPDETIDDINRSWREELDR